MKNSFKSLMLILLFGVVSLSSVTLDKSTVLASSESSGQVACRSCGQKAILNPVDALFLQSRSKRFAMAAAPANKPSNSNRQDPLSESLAGLNINGPIMDRQMTDNVTNSLNDMAQNLRRMFMENRKLQNQLQDVFGRLQNVTGVNVSTVAQNMPKNTNGMVNNIMNRLQQQQ